MFLEILGTNDPNEIMSEFSAGSRNLVVVHPRPVRQLKEEFLRIKGGLKERAPSAEVISTGQLLPLFIQDERRRKIIENEWEHVLNEILSALIKSWPIIAVQQQRKVFDESKSLIRSSRPKYEMRQLTDSVRDAGIACEGILRIMCEIYEPSKVEKPPSFSDLLQVLHTHIVNEFGADIVHDLEFIREWRNKTTHAGYDPPKSLEAFKVLTKAELFMNLFESELLLRGRRDRSAVIAL